MNRRTRVLPPQPVISQELERRRFPRHAANVATQSHLVATDVGEVSPRSILSISAGGISLITDLPIAPGRIATLDLYHIARRFFCQIPVRVVTLTGSEGSFIVRGAFTRELTQGELQALL